jgi:ubiquinone biosynthesis protein
MERVNGVKLTEHGLRAASEKSELARLAIQALIARPIFTKTGDALFHGDPHAGNLLLATDGRLAVLDWSLIGFLGHAERAALVQLIFAALTLDAERIVATLVCLDQRQGLDPAALRKTVHTRLGRIRRGQFPGFTWLLGLLDEAVTSCRLRVNADLLLFRKAINTLEGVIVDTGACTIDDVLLSEFLRRFATEWTERWRSRPDSRQFATCVSNADLAELLLTLPTTMARFWFP